MKWIVFVSLVFCGSFGLAQATDMQQQISHQATSGLVYQKRPVRRWMDGQDQHKLQRINPLWYVSGALLFVYQNVLSEQIQADCNFQLSCSGYTKKCIEQHGLLVGMLLGADQLNTCQANVYLDYENTSINGSGKIINDTPNR